MAHTDVIDPDQELLDAVPAFLSIGSLLKASPKTEGAERFVYLEASNESKDQQNEVLLSKALEESAAYYKQFGNIDLDHVTQIGLKQGIPNYEGYEIGRPVDVRIDGKSTFVKARIYTGVGPAADNANMFWSSITDLSPPKQWYPSVGGAVMGKEIVIDPITKSKHAVINKVRWTNVAVSRTPVNADLRAVSTQSFGPLAKSWAAALEKSLTAGYGTDSATLTGGGALRGGNGASAGASYWDFRDQLAQCFRTGECAGMKLPALLSFCRLRFGLSASDASEYMERFLDDFQRGLQEQKK